MFCSNLVILVVVIIFPFTLQESYNSLGGTGPKAVAAMLEKFNQQLKNHRDVIKADKDRAAKGYNTSRAIASEIGSVESAEDIARLVKKHSGRSY